MIARIKNMSMAHMAYIVAETIFTSIKICYYCFKTSSSAGRLAVLCTQSLSIYRIIIVQ